MSGKQSPRRRRFGMPREIPLPQYRLASRPVEEAFEAAGQRPTDPEGHTEDAPPALQDPQLPVAEVEPLAEKGASALTFLFFFVSFLGSMTFCAAYLWIPFHHDYGLEQNLAEGTGLGVAFLGVALGLLSLAKTSAPPVLSVQERGSHHAPEEDEVAAEDAVILGFQETTLAKRKFVRRAMLLALGAIPLPFVFSLRDTGPRPRDALRQTRWKPNVRLVDPDTREPWKASDLSVGGLATAMPEDAPATEPPVNAESPVVLIRLPAGANQPLPGRENWVVNDEAGTVVCYSKICTHAGCPVGLYESRDHYLLCPCHQSTFDVPQHCKVLFGPAARPLPQLPIYVDTDGYLRARSAFDQPVGPSFWERDGSGASHL